VARGHQRRCQKKRSQQRTLVKKIARTIITAELEAEREAKEKGKGKATHLKPDDLLEAESKGLVDEANVEIFLTWWSFGGAQHGLTPMQAAEMPAAMRKDFGYLLEEISRERKRQKHLESAREKKKP
jgi:hypothetical protein